MPTAYFAFGSNMSADRMSERIPESRSRGRGLLREWRFVCNKSGMDGSAKANMVPEPGGSVWGVVYDIPTAALARLDAIEGGYRRIAVEVLLDSGERVRCQSYCSTLVTADGRPFDWYKALLLGGARAHRLPAEYVAEIESLTDRAAHAH